MEFCESCERVAFYSRYDSSDGIVAFAVAQRCAFSTAQFVHPPMMNRHRNIKCAAELHEQHSHSV